DKIPFDSTFNADFLDVDKCLGTYHVDNFVPASFSLTQIMPGWNEEVLKQSPNEFNTQIKKADEDLEKLLTSSLPHIEIHSEAIYSRRRFTPLSITSSYKIINCQDIQRKENVDYVEKDNRKTSPHIKIQPDAIFNRRQSIPLTMTSPDKKINHLDKQENVESSLVLQDVINIEQDNGKISTRVEIHSKTVFNKSRLVFLKIENSSEKRNQLGNNYFFSEIVINGYFNILTLVIS
ncbi:9673_t:CDS:2, partial [Dentiscutata heterogama]